ncbi:unnamed protein product [Calypogeia fissa]
MAYLHTTPSLVGLSFRDARMVNRRINENTRESMQKYLKDDDLAKIHTETIHRADNKGIVKRIAEDRFQTAQLEAMEKRAEARKFAKMEREDKELLERFKAEELRQHQRDELILEAMKDRSPEIRLLKRMLQVAQMNKERYGQRQDKALYEMEDADRNAAFHEMLMENYNKLTKIEQERLQKVADEKIAIRKKLDDQMKEKEWEAAKLLRDKVHDKELVESVVAKEAELDRLEAQRKKNTVVLLQKFIKEYLVQKEEYDRAAKAQKVQDEKDLLDYQAKMEARQREIDEKKRIEKELKDKIYGMLSEGQEEAQREREEMEHALNELYFQQAEEAYHQKAEALRIHREHMKANMRASSEAYWALKKHRYEQGKIQQAAWADQMTKEMMAEQKFQQMSAYKQRMKKAEYKHQLDTQWEERIYLLEQEAAAEKAKRRKEKEEYVRQEKMLEDERQRILQECAEELAKFFPKGVCRDQDELRKVGLPAVDKAPVRVPIPHRLPTL